jgi:HNH endonuclease
MRNDADIGADFREYMTWWAAGSNEDRLDLYNEIARSERTAFPWEPAVDALSKLDAKVLWRTFVPEELQELREWAEEAGLGAAAKRFQAAEDDIPFRDPGRIPLKIREGVMKRDGYRCQEPGCGATEHLSVDHIVPWIEGGSSADPSNLQVLCQSCNSRKGARMAPTTATSKRRRLRGCPVARRSL